MLNYYKYRQTLNEMSLNNFISDASNEETYKLLYSLSNSPSFAGKKILLSGPKRSGKTHLIVSLLKSLLKSTPTLKIEKTTGEAFLSNVIWEYQNSGYKSFSNYIDSLLEKDILILEEINYIDGQLKGHAITKKALLDLLDRWNSSKKLLVFSIDSSSEHQILDNEMTTRLNDFQKNVIHQQGKSLIGLWLERAVSISQVPITQQIKEKIIAESDSIPRARYELLNHYFQNYKEFFDFCVWEEYGSSDQDMMPESNYYLQRV